MRNYERPVVLVNSELSEGVYAASGASGSACYSTTAYIHQTPETGRGDYRIQVNAHHDADHNCNGQILTISFNQSVDFVSCSEGTIIGSTSGTTLQLKMSYWNNHTDNIGLGDLVVTSDAGLSIASVSVDDADYRS